MQKTNKTLGLRFGPLADSIESQLAAAGLEADPAVAGSFQKDADALSRLAVRGLLTERSIRDGRKKLMKMISASVREKESAEKD